MLRSSSVMGKEIDKKLHFFVARNFPLTQNNIHRFVLPLGNRFLNYVVLRCFDNDIFLIKSRSYIMIVGLLKPMRWWWCWSFRWWRCMSIVHCSSVLRWNKDIKYIIKEKELLFLVSFIANNSKKSERFCEQKTGSTAKTYLEVWNGVKDEVEGDVYSHISVFVQIVLWFVTETSSIMYSLSRSKDFW